jgi:ABC-2 type transport system ATP-binding protein
MMISISGLIHSYKGVATPALDGLNLEIPSGSFFGLLGPNGAGKTTTISIIAGLIKPKAGTLLIDGKSWNTDSKSIKRSIGLVPQEIALYDSLTAAENLQFFGNNYGLNGSDLDSEIDELLENFGLQEHRKKLISEFSGGMKRRVNLMVALLNNPKVLILDEPTVGIDVHSRHMINTYLKKLNAGGMTMIYTSHQLEETEKLCDRLAIMDHGKLIAEGETQDLISKTEGHTLNDLFIHLTGNKLRD